MSLQYFKPQEEGKFVGDCMPFFHEGVFHLYYLLDEGHHQGKGGLGGHQWAHASTTDLVQWEHHPMAIPITEERETSICTGSVFFHGGVFHGYYATRMPDGTEHLSLAVSTDGVRFTKTEPNPFASPGPEYTSSFRDPHVFCDPETGLFHMLVTTSLREPPCHGRGGCLAQFISRDLKTWEPAEPFIMPGDLGDPECPEHFHWNGWWYLVFSQDGVARYRMSRGPLGPWRRPGMDTFDGPMASVLKSAAFTGNRRIGAAFLPSLDGNRDDGAWQYAGNAVFREIIQHGDGTLGTRFPPEMVPDSGPPLDPPLSALTAGVTGDGGRVRLEAPAGFATAALEGVPPGVRITLLVEPEPGSAHFGVCLRGAGSYESGYELRLSPFEGKVGFRSAQCRAVSENARRSILGVERLEGPFRLEIVMHGDIIDVCVDGRRCLVNRFPSLRGDRLFLFAQNATVEFGEVEVRPLA